ncbi:flagellar basal-body rod protein FlgG [Amphiplicatus metriothermophilus]|uniref:Flagellar basal-body rod protein FlgG n=1 Tax=Amphiplicatus metriothermophilus TaxID=1519374 RepID=A0A239PL49_9PROT|nr:flagellar basal-body rod protein FlgG [Amphiplicatus metriothermophilus]MBB5517317.1 flagellar basal-body rod protein FlgG [Amphiplicatus metriothermophilus]SNT68347.1 flagellar basal-body rod protein FlgG [Amphiplicatus metriothermophilus]
MRALSIAATGMDAQQTRVEVISNNLANMNTTAYAPRRAEFADLHYQIVRAAGAPSSSNGDLAPEGVHVGLGVRTASITVDMRQGALKSTGGDLDLAIEGKGFFEIRLPSGEAAYTRDGAFKRTGEGLVVNSEGFPLAGDITIPEDARSVVINAEGEVYVHFEDQPEAQLIATINLVSFANPNGLEPIGGNLYRETAASGPPVVGEAGEDGLGRLRQGYLEESGVDVVAQIAELIEAQRGYELNSKVIAAADQMLGATTQLR